MATNKCKHCENVLHPTETRAGFTVCIRCVVWNEDLDRDEDVE